MRPPPSRRSTMGSRPTGRGSPRCFRRHPWRRPEADPPASTNTIRSCSVPTDFRALGVADDLATALAATGITEPFPIQALTIPDALTGRDICGKAKTGSGKTLAFGLPLVERTGRAEPGRPRALVLVPTRELALQVHKV